MKLIHRVQEWLADQFNFVSCPSIKKIKPKQDWQPYGSSPIIEVEQHSGKVRITILGTILLLIYAGITLIIGLAAMTFGCFVLWVIISSLF